MFKLISAGTLSKFQSSKYVSKEFQRRFKEVSRVFKESVKCVSRKFHKKYQESLNEVYFALLLHESHRSYPSRRRACL